MWIRTKRQRGIPEMQKVLLESEEWACGETRQAKLAPEWCSDRGDQVAQELRSLTHDVTTAGHGRDYRIVDVSLRGLLTSRQISAGVFDLRNR